VLVCRAGIVVLVHGAVGMGVQAAGIVVVPMIVVGVPVRVGVGDPVSVPVNVRMQWFGSVGHWVDFG